MREREGKKKWRKILNRSSDGTYDRKQLKYDLIIIWDCHTWSYLWHSSHSPPLSRSRRLQPDTVDSANPKRINDFWTSKIPIEQIRLEEIEEKERESSSRRRKKRRARAEVLTSGRRRLDAIPQPLIGESTSTPLPNSHDATLVLIVVSLLYHCSQ